MKHPIYTKQFMLINFSWTAFFTIKLKEDIIVSINMKR